MSFHRTSITLICVALFSVAAAAQTGTRVVRASGSASVSVEPDEARVQVGVITKAATAAQAASENATRVDAVISRLRQVLGESAEIKTINYSLYPEYQRPSQGQQVLVGFVASNTVEVTITDLSLIGNVIDSATDAGANSVNGLRFTLQDPEPVRSEALGLAAQQARAHAAAIAEGLNEQIGDVLIAQEGTTIGPPLTDYALGARESGTPIETGLVEIRATVTVEVELR